MTSLNPHKYRVSFKNKSQQIIEANGHTARSVREGEYDHAFDVRPGGLLIDARQNVTMVEQQTGSTWRRIWPRFM